MQLYCKEQYEAENRSPLQNFTLLYIWPEAYVPSTWMSPFIQVHVQVTNITLLQEGQERIFQISLLKLHRSPLPVYEFFLTPSLLVCYSCWLISLIPELSIWFMWFAPQQAVWWHKSGRSGQYLRELCSPSLGWKVGEVDRIQPSKLQKEGWRVLNLG